VIAVLVQYGDVTHLLLVCGVFVVGQLLEGYVLVPKLVGDKIGLHPVAVIFAVLAGGELFGFLGVLLALPAASVIMVLLRYLVERYRQSELYTDEGDEDPVIAEVDIVVHNADGSTVETDTTVPLKPGQARAEPHDAAVAACAALATPPALRTFPSRRQCCCVRSGAGVGLDAGAPWVYLHGSPGSGRSHLLMAACQAANAAGRAVQYLPLATLDDSAAALRGVAGSGLLALDDLGAIAGNRDAEHALFDLYNQAKAEGSALLFAADTTPAQLGLVLPDLRSRLGACTQFAIKPLDDEERRVGAESPGNFARHRTR
jgi:DnaA regulatory inactivator Hda